MSSSQKKPARKTEIIARQSMSTFVLKMLLCKQANVNESDYDVRFKGRIVPTSSTGANVITLGECGITKETTSGVSLWENEACRRRKVADELDAIRREKREQFYDGAHAREEARREIERIKAKNSYASESIGTDGGGTLERQDTSRYGYMPSSSSRRRRRRHKGNLRRQKIPINRVNNTTNNIIIVFTTINNITRIQTRITSTTTTITTNHQ